MYIQQFQGLKASRYWKVNIRNNLIARIGRVTPYRSFLGIEEFKLTGHFF